MPCARGSWLASISTSVICCGPQERWSEARDALRTRPASCRHSQSDDWSSRRRNLAYAIERVGTCNGNWRNWPAALASYRDALAIRAHGSCCCSRPTSAFGATTCSRVRWLPTFSIASAERRRAIGSGGQAFAIVEEYADGRSGQCLASVGPRDRLLSLAYYLDDDPAPQVERAREIVRRLEAQGKLAPDRKAYIDQLEQQLIDKPKPN